MLQLWSDVIPAGPRCAIADAGGSRQPVRTLTGSGTMGPVTLNTPVLPLSQVLDGTLTDELVQHSVDFMDARHDTADFRAAKVVAALYLAASGRGTLSQQHREQLTGALLRFRHWIDEPGQDDMCFWSENHQVLFGATDYLTGALLPDAVFDNDGTTGAEHRIRAARRLRAWLARRLRFGFSEWLSNSYYEEDLGGLMLLVDHAPDADIARDATAVVDVLMRDLAHHSWLGPDGVRYFSASSGRQYAGTKRFPQTIPLQPVLRHAFDEPVRPGDPGWVTGLNELFLLSSYQVPKALVAIAHLVDDRTEQRFGVDLRRVQQLIDDEVAAANSDGGTATGTTASAACHARILRDHRAVRSAGYLEIATCWWWALEAFSTPEAIVDTMRAFVRYRLDKNPYLRGVKALTRVPAPLLPLAVRVLNPVTRGVALDRATVVTTRRPNWVLSSAQHYNPGGFGAQQHLWQAILPGGASILATHPGGRLFSPDPDSYDWCGNGINPDVAQHGRVLIALHDLRERHGLLEGRREVFTHLWWPTSTPTNCLDEHLQGPGWLAGRAGNGLVGVRSLAPLAHPEPNRATQSGLVTGWIVVMGQIGDNHDPDDPTRQEYASLADFARWLEALPLLQDDNRISLWIDGERLDAGYRAGLRVSPAQSPDS